MHAAKFTSRHIGPRAEDQQTMLRTIGVASIEDLVAKTVPGKIRQRERMSLTPALSSFVHVVAMVVDDTNFGIGQTSRILKMKRLLRHLTITEVRHGR